MVTITVANGWLGLNGSQAWYVTVPFVLLALLAAMAFCGALNVSIERVAYRPLRNAPKLAPLITAIGMSFLLQNVGAAIWGFNERPLTSTGVEHLPGQHPVQDRRGALPGQVADRRPDDDPGAARCCGTSCSARSRARRCARSPQDMDASRMMGIDVDRTIAFTFALGGALAGAAGTLFVMFQTSTRFDLGFQLGLFAFTAAVLGGIGNLTGAALGALLIGLIQAFNEGLSWHTPGSDWTESIIFAILILVLVFRPQGLLGEATADRA